MKSSDFDYQLPESQIAQAPVTPRDASRLLHLDRATGSVAHHTFRDLPSFLRPDDLLVLNDTKVIPARLIGEKVGTGGKVELLLLERQEIGTWTCLARPARRLRPGARVTFGGGALTAEVTAETESAIRVVTFSWEEGTFEEALKRVGRLPLPPYIKRELKESDRYQTVFAREEGAKAAPTAGLHFTPELLQAIADLGVAVRRVTLHVGLGTFQPVKVDEVTEHTMHAEYYRVTPEVAEAVRETRRRGGRVIAVGTTVVRTLESALDGEGRLLKGEGWTSLFIYPGYTFKVIDGLVTNFHLPKSTLLMMVSAFAGKERVLAAYREALAQGYRFFSFGDAMLIL